jgi:hypothetical protein
MADNTGHGLISTANGVYQIKARFEVVTAVLLKIKVFCEVMPRSWVNGSRRLEVSYCLLQVQVFSEENRLQLNSVFPGVIQIMRPIV